MTHVFWSASYLGFPTISGAESFQAVDQLHDGSAIGLLNVTRRSTTPGATSLVPASGTVLTTTGAIASMSCESMVRGMSQQEAVAMRSIGILFIDLRNEG